MAADAVRARSEETLVFKALSGGATRRNEEAELRRALAGRIHCLDGEGAGVFVRDSIWLVTCGAGEAAALDAFLAGSTLRRASRQHGVTEAQVMALIDVIRESAGGGPGRIAPDATAGEAAGDGSGPRTLDRLVLNVSNDCNLRCAYCYAGGGAYGRRRGLMSSDTALTAVDVFFAAFPRINRIQFFGGEPLLNLEGIEAVARDVEDRRTAGRLPEPPRLGVVTNGTLEPHVLAGLCRRYGIGVTISVDGPRKIHDRLRGAGTFDRVRTFADTLASERIEFGIEGTDTSLRFEAGLALTDLLAFYRREFGLAEVHVPWCSRPPGDSLAPLPGVLEAQYREAVACSLDPDEREHAASLGFAKRLLDAVTKRKAEDYCPAGLATLAVDAEGDIYPCFMFVGQPRLRLGNVRSGLAGAGAADELLQRLLAGKSGPECDGCWARPLCFGCVGADYVVNGGPSRQAGASCCGRWLTRRCGGCWRQRETETRQWFRGPACRRMRDGSAQPSNGRSYAGTESSGVSPVARRGRHDARRQVVVGPADQAGRAEDDRGSRFGADSAQRPAQAHAPEDDQGELREDPGVLEALARGQARRRSGEGARAGRARGRDGQASRPA